MAVPIGKTLWLALAAVVAVPVAGFELDREAWRNEAIAPLVPGPFRYFAFEPLIAAAYDRQDTATGIALSREMIRRRPVPSEGLALLAYGQLGEGDEADAARSLIQAGQRGWRNRFTQDMLVVMALQSRDWDVAAQRLLALWRVGLDDDRLKGMTAQLLSQPQGAAAFAAQLGAEGEWSNGFIAWAGETLGDDALQRTMRALAANGAANGGGGGARHGARHRARVRCGPLATKLPALVRAGRPGAAAILWNAFCAGGQATAPADFRFRPVSDTRLPGPFDWRYPEVEGIERGFSARGGQATIRYSNRSALRNPVARRAAVLPAGRYAVRIDARAQGEAGFRPLVLRISCFPARGTGYRLAEIAASGDSAANSAPNSARHDFAIPARDCVSQELELVAGRGEGEIRKLTIAPL